MVLLSRKGLKRRQRSASVGRLSICVLGGVLCAVAATVLAVTDPILYLTQMHMHIFNGSEVHQFLSESMHGVHVSAYLFNITNADEFLGGRDRALRVREVGPFTYKETRTNEDMEIDPKNGVLRYSPKISLEFVPEESVARPQDVNVTMPNLPMLGVSSQVSSYPYWTRVGFNMLARQLNSKPIVKMDASTYMWGYKDPLLTLGHTVVPGMFGFDKIGILDRLYNSGEGNRLEVGATMADTLMIKKRNGHRKLAMAEHEDPDACELCDTFDNAYEGVLYPSPVTPETPIRIFRNGLCRILPMEFHERVTMDYGAEGLVFNLSDSFFSFNGTDAKGLLDLSTCYYGLPISLTRSHFLGVDPAVYERVEGMRPDPRKHNSYIVIEPKMGMELETNVQIQMNLVLGDLDHSPEAMPFSNMVVPISYLAIVQPKLDQETLDILKQIYVDSPPLFVVMQAVFLVLALVLFSYSVLLVFRIRKQKESKLSEKLKNMTVISVQEPLVNKTVS